MPLLLHFLRHGQTTFSRDNALCGAGTDAELTEPGREMAVAFAAAYRATSWSAVYASPLKRAVATARPLCDAIGREPELLFDLREIDYGAWEGRTPEEVSRDDHDAYLRFVADPAFHPPTGGETALAIERRVRRVLDQVGVSHSGGNVLLVSHKATIRIALCSLLGIDVGRFRDRIACPVASLSVVEVGPRGPLVRRLADRSHLTPELRDLPGT